MMNDQEVVDTIRNDSRVGKGSCSVWDECYSDQELIKYFHGYSCVTIHQTL